MAGIEFSRDGSVLTITLRRPSVINAIDDATLEALAEGVELARETPDVRAVHLRAGGRHFSSGADIREEVLPEAELLRRSASEHAVARLYALQKPSVVSLQGYCIGGALELALACDIRIAGSDARFRFPEVELGLTPGWGGAVLLRDIVGRGRAMDLLLSGRWVDAREALVLGLVARVCAPAHLERQGRQMAKALAGLPPDSVAAVKQSLRDDGFEAALRSEMATFAWISHTEDAQARLAAFRRKRRRAVP
jgi:enoyl-CoA hydratase/carnithine racemase